MKKHSGFTLIEVMVVLAIAGVVLGIGIPKLSVFFQGSRMVTNTNALVAALQIAKSEAVKRQGPVTVCRSNDDQTDCVSNDDNTWEDGFIVFYDLGTKREVDGTDIILRINTGAEGDDVTIRSNSDTQNEDRYITFSSRGHPKNGTALQSATYILCDDRQNDDGTINSVDDGGVSKTAARGVVLNVSGKVRSTRDAAALTGKAPDALPNCAPLGDL